MRMRAEAVRASIVSLFILAKVRSFPKTACSLQFASSVTLSSMGTVNKGLMFTWCLSQNILEYKVDFSKKLLV